MLINENNFVIYNADTENSILQRIAVLFQTTPFWLWIKESNESGFSEKTEIKVVNILEELKRDIKQYISFKDVETKYYEWILQKDEGSIQDSKYELSKMFIIFYVDEDVDYFKKLELEEIFKDISGTEINIYTIEQILSRKKEIEMDLKREILRNKKEAKIFEDYAIQIEKDVESVTDINSSDFNVESIVTTLTVETEKDIVLSHVFNELNSDDILFCKYKKFFKIIDKNKHVFNYYDFDSDYSDNELLIVFFLAVKKKYLFREIVIKEHSPSIFTVDIDTIESEVNFNELQQILLNTGFTVTDQNNTRIKGNFIIDKNFHKELFLDVIMNDSAFFNMYANERYKVNKNFSKINLYYYSLKSSHVSFSLSNEVNTTKIKINKISSYEAIDFFKKQFITLFKQYKSKENVLLNIYRSFIPGISLSLNTGKNNDSTMLNRKKRSKHPLALIEPTLFLPLYTRKCAKPPRIIDDEKIPDGFSTIEFPLYKEGGLNARRYVCDQTGHFMYPGLRKNTLPNNNVFKYIPCCYETDQEQRKGSCWNSYFKGVTGKNDKYEHVLYKTSRILPNENKGILPQGILKLLGKDVMRKGVFIGPNSFIDCVERIANKSLVIGDVESRRKQLNKIRKSLRYELCSQENSDLKDFKDWFYNEKLYFEPRRFFRALEDYFQINIYIFERSTDHVCSFSNNKLLFEKTISHNGILVAPNTPSQGVFIDPKRYNKNALIYNHMGGAVDSLEYPHCEYIPITNSKIFKNVETVYRNILIFSRKDYIDDNKVKLSEISEQYIDRSGRVIGLKRKDGEIIKMEKPMLPIAKKIKCEKLDSKQNYLKQYVYQKRLARIFVEYCMIKYATSTESSVSEFLNNHSKIDEHFIFVNPSAEYSLEYYDTIFLINDKIIFDSIDTRKRIEYSMKIIEKRETTLKFKNWPYIFSYFATNLDFEGFVVNESTFKEFAYQKPQGLTFHNSIEELRDLNLIIVKDNLRIDLNGYFGVFNSIQELKSRIIRGTEEYTTEDLYYIWNENTYIIKRVLEGKGRVVVIYKFNSTVYYLGKYKSV